MGGGDNLGVGINTYTLLYIKQVNNKDLLGFPADAVVKNLPANAGDMGLIPGLGRSHMPHSN